MSKSSFMVETPWAAVTGPRSLGGALSASTTNPPEPGGVGSQASSMPRTLAQIRRGELARIFISTAPLQRARDTRADLRAPEDEVLRSRSRSPDRRQAGATSAELLA
ncbi:hypothetical protein BE11_18955 [Sorangium cellulosum]|nr:hypothetical protein BE11_18955 [Sorangium cellulosum]